MNGFAVRALQQNLMQGRGISLKLPHIAAINVTFNLNTDSLKGPLNSFYVNELPRIHTSNKHIVFSTSETDSCSLQVQTVAGVKRDVDLKGCKSAQAIYAQLVASCADGQTQAPA
jgi:hypothetical protein